LSQRLSRLVSVAGAPAVRAVRATLLGVAMTGSVANLAAETPTKRKTAGLVPARD
jgi:hypothetical protein